MFWCPSPTYDGALPGGQDQLPLLPGEFDRGSMAPKVDDGERGAWASLSSSNGWQWLGEFGSKFW